MLALLFSSSSSTPTSQGPIGSTRDDQEKHSYIQYRLSLHLSWLRGLCTLSPMEATADSVLARPPSNTNSPSHCVPGVSSPGPSSASQRPAPAHALHTSSPPPVVPHWQLRADGHPASRPVSSTPLQGDPASSVCVTPGQARTPSCSASTRHPPPRGMQQRARPTTHPTTELLTELAISSAPLVDVCSRSAHPPCANRASPKHPVRAEPAKNPTWVLRPEL